MKKQFYEVKKGRTITCKMGVVHAGGKVSIDNFTGENDEEKQKIIDGLETYGFLEKIKDSESEDSKKQPEQKSEDSEKQPEQTEQKSEDSEKQPEQKSDKKITGARKKR